MTLPPDYLERVYAGVLGKIIGVYLGRPFEGWTHERIMRELGEIRTYVHDRLGKPLIVPDDDITGTFTFLRALPDHGNSAGLTPAEIGATWLNYIVEGRTILWWGGLGNSTEHTAYLRLKSGVPAPDSGSIALNGKVVAEQIGAQIFIDGWAMVAPGDPELAARLASKAASVSHDGEAVYAAVVLAAMEAQAFVESDVSRVIDGALAFIPADSVIRRLIDDLREWRAQEPDWRRARERLAAKYGYDRFGGNCHVVPNHGLIHLGLLYGEDDFRQSLSIVNTCGWDTDCNSGNLGCLLGIKNGLKGIEAGPDWRGPVADRLYLPTADGGRAISDAAAEAIRIANIGRSLAGEPSIAPKAGARFHFELPGSVQGFEIQRSPDVDHTASVENIVGHSAAGRRSLAIRYPDLVPGRPLRVLTPTFIPPQALQMPGYGLPASPTLYPGQILTAAVSADAANSQSVRCRLTTDVYGAQDVLSPSGGPEVLLEPGEQMVLEWRIPDGEGTPIADVGFELGCDSPASGVVYLDYLTWEGAPEVSLVRPSSRGKLWRRAWVEGVDMLVPNTPEPIRVVQNRGRGLLIQGAREWKDYRACATVVPHLVSAGGIAVRVQGLQRYYALLFVREGRLQLLRVVERTEVLAQEQLAWEFGQAYELALQVERQRLRAWLDGSLMFDVDDPIEALDGGGVALVCEEGCLSCTDFHISPPSDSSKATKR